jgi:prolipoprotein diacylglyceryltransferase
MTLYALFYVASFALFLILAAHMIRARGLDGKLAGLLAIVYLVGMMMGAHALYFPFVEHTMTSEAVQQSYARLPAGQESLLAKMGQLRALAFAGLWGGPWFTLLGLLLFVILLRLDRRAKEGLLDVFAISFAFALALSKLACLANGCCHGVEGIGPLFVRFTWVPEYSASYMKRCFPTQVLDLAVYALIGAGLLVAYRRKPRDGRLILWFVLLYAGGRFATEFTRGDNVGGKVYGLSPVQIVLLAALPISLFLLSRPRLFERILSLRAPSKSIPSGRALPPTAQGVRIDRLDTSMRWVLLALVLACYTIAPVVPLLLLAVLLLAARTYACLKARDDPVHWSRLHNAFTYAGLVILFVLAFLSPYLGLFFIGFVVFAAVEAAILTRFWETMGAGMEQPHPQARVS